MTFLQLLEALRSRYPILIVCVGLAVAAAIVLTRLQPEQYTSTVALIVDVTDPIRTDERTTRSEPSQAYIATQLDIINSLAVAARVVERLDLVSDPYFAELVEAEGSMPPKQRIRRVIAEGMSARPSRDSQVVSIGFTSSNPEVSARIANGFADAYLELVLEMSVEPARREAEWFDEQRSDIRQWVEDARNRLSGYQQEMGILTSDERVDIETSKLQELSHEVIAAQTAASEANALANEVDRQLERDRDGLSLPDAAASALYQSLQADLSAQDATIARLMGSLGPQHPRLARARAEREDIVARLDAEIDKVRTTLRRNAELAAAKHAALSDELERQRKHVLELNRVKDKIPMLQRDVENAEEAYRLALEQYSVNTLQSRLRNVNASVLHRAEPAARPSGPDLRTNVGAAVFLGTLAGLMVVLLMEWVDPRVRSPRTLKAQSVPYLGALEGHKYR